MPPPKIIELKASMSDEDFKAKYEGTHFDEEVAKLIVREDSDIYGLEPDGTRRLLAKFRRGVIPPSTVQNGWDSFRTLAMPGRNRGAAAGPIDFNSPYWKKRDPIKVKDDKTYALYERYAYKGPFKTDLEMKQVLANVTK